MNAAKIIAISCVVMSIILVIVLAIVYIIFRKKINKRISQLIAKRIKRAKKSDVEKEVKNEKSNTAQQISSHEWRQHMQSGTDESPPQGDVSSAVPPRRIETQEFITHRQSKEAITPTPGELANEDFH